MGCRLFVRREETENLDRALITVTSKNLKVNSSLLGAPVHET